MTDTDGVAALARQQSALLQAIWPGDWQALPSAGVPDIPLGGHGSAHGDDRGLHAYRAHALAQAEGALMTVYPVVTQIMGAADAALLARALWHSYPPHAGDLAAWGGDLAILIDAQAQLTDVPFLSDLARLEWALHTLAALPDLQADWPSLAHLAEGDAHQWRGRWAPGLAVLSSAWPVVSIWQAHQLPDAQALQQALDACLTQPQPEAAVLWRQGFKPCVRPALAGEACWLASMDRTQPLALSIDQAVALDVAAWLPLAVTTGMLLALDPAAAPAPQTTVTQ
jgi:Putative DNA-binding domain